MNQPKIVLLGLLTLALTAAAAWAQEPKQVTRESSLTATVNRIDRFTRTVTLKTVDGIEQTVLVGPEIQAFDELQRGDTVTVRFTDSVIVQVRPGAKPGPPVETTAEARKGSTRPGDVVKQVKMTVTIERIDPDGQSVVYRTDDNRMVRRYVQDKRLIEGLREGDRVEVTFTRERAISIERGRR